MLLVFRLTCSARKEARYTSQQWPHESYIEKTGAGWFRAFFGTKTPRIFQSPDSGTDRQDTRPTNSTAETLSVEGAGGRKKSFSSQLACSMLCMDTLGIEPRAFCMRSGCTHPSNGHTSPTLRKWGRDDLAHGHTGDWAQGLLHAKRMYTSQQWPHESYTEKMGAGWFKRIFWTRTSQ